MTTEDHKTVAGPWHRHRRTGRDVGVHLNVPSRVRLNVLRFAAPDQLFRRYAPGAVPCVRLNALAKANSDV